MRALRHGLRNHFNQLGMRMPVDKCAKGHHEIDIVVAIRIPNMRTASAFQHNWARMVDCRASRGGVHPFDERLLRPLEPLL